MVIFCSSRCFVFRGNVQNTVSIDIEGHFDLRHAAWCRVNTIR